MAGEGARASDDFRPTVFIGSSSEGLRVAERLKQGLDADYEVRIWSEGVFGVGDMTLPRLLEVAREVDFAVLCLTADDLLSKRLRDSKHAPRDNVIFEAGLFMGQLGSARTLLVSPEEALDLPSDLAGLTRAMYPAGEVEHAVPVAARAVLAAIEEFRPRELYASSHATARDFDWEFRHGARGSFVVGEEEGEPLLTLEWTVPGRDAVLRLKSYGEQARREEFIRRDGAKRRELRVELEARADRECKLAIQLKVKGAGKGQILAKKERRLQPGSWHHLGKTFRITTIEPFRVRLRQREVAGTPSRLDIRRLSVVESVVRD